MHKKDYLQRQFEEFGKVLATLLSFKRNGDWEKFEEEIALATQKFTTLELTLLEALNEVDFKVKTFSTALSYDQKKILANLLFEKMNSYLERNQTEKFIDLKAKCLALYTHLTSELTHNEFDLEAHYRLEFLSK